MKCIYLLPLLMVSIACQRQEQMQNALASSSPSIKVTSVSNPSRPADDPTFVLPKDTLSLYGPQSITRSVWQDRRGMYWFATWEGILRYDGQTFTNMALKENLGHYRVFSILEDHKGYLWFGTLGGGVYCYDGNSFSQFSTQDGLPSNTVISLLEDRSGNIWLGTDKGVSRYSGTVFVNFNQQQGLNGAFVNTMLQDRNGLLWLGTRNGLYQYDGKSFTEFTNGEGVSLNNIPAILEDHKGNIWMGTQSGLVCYDPLASSRSGRKSLISFARNFAPYLIQDKTGQLWFSQALTDKNAMALFRYDGTDFVKVQESTQVFGITEDHSGNIWFGSANGVYSYDGKRVTDYRESVNRTK